MLSTTIAYANITPLNPSLILNRSRFLLGFCFIESYQINLLPQKLNLMIMTTGHISSVTLISFSTADLCQPDLVPESPWRDTWSFRSDILDFASDIVIGTLPLQRVFSSITILVSLKWSIQVEHVLCSRVLLSINFRVEHMFSIPKDNFTHTYLIILANKLPVLLKTFFKTTHFPNKYFHVKYLI